MIFSLDIRRANKGDCLILHYGSAAAPGLILIDGGPSKVYEPHLKPRLADIRKARGLDEDATLPVDLIMASHIDDDHIIGLLELTHELVEASDNGQRLPLKVRDFWHNSFDKIIGKSPKELLGSVTAAFGAASLGDGPDAEGLDPDVGGVLSSVAKGIRLSDDTAKLNKRVSTQFRPNHQFEGQLVMAKEDGKPIDMGKGLKLTVAGPMKPELVKLQKEHDDFLKKKEEDKSKAALASLMDDSVPNLASLVLLAEVDSEEVDDLGKAKTKSLLLTGDALGKKIVEGLELVGLLKKEGVLHVDILKMPHHGSSRNADRDFFKRITADHYVFSGNGQHGNPERDTLQMLLDEKGDANYKIYLTYPIGEIDVFRKQDWEIEQGKERKRKLTKPATVVRDDWSPEKNSLAAFFAANEDFAKKVIIVEQDTPRVIDLLEKIGF